MFSVSFKSQALVVIGIAVGGGLVSASTAAQAASEHAYGARAVSSFDWYRGDHEIRTNPTPPTGRAFAMPNQVWTDYVPSFVAIGTAKGAGVDNCPSAYGGSWEVYTDGVRPSGTYFCNTDGPANEYGAGNRSNFAIRHVACGWQLGYGGSARRCVTASGYPSNGVRMSAGIEEVNSVAADYNIDAKYYGLEYSTNGGSSWHDMIPTTASDPGYTATSPNNRRVFAYHGVLN